jgi:hypothetical protein
VLGVNHSNIVLPAKVSQAACAAEIDTGFAANHVDDVA